MYQLLPTNLNIETHLAKHTPAFARFRADALVHLLHLVVTIPTENPEMAKEQEAGPGYIPLSAQRLRAWLPNYNEYLAYAVATKLLETDNHFKRANGTKPGKCRGYRFAAQYRREEHQSTTTNYPPVRLVKLQDPKFIRKLKKHRDKRFKINQQHGGDYQHLLRWLNPQTTPLRIHEDQAKAYLKERWKHAGSNPEQGGKKKKRYQQERVQYKDPDVQYQHGLTSINKLSEREGGGHVDETAGRLHTPLTNMRGDLRKWVYAEGYGPLVAIDLNNSQPYLANMMLNLQFYGPERSFPKEYPAPRQRKRKGRKRGTLTRDPRHLSSFTMSNILKHPDCEELELFRKWTSNGTFYEDMAQALNAQAEDLPSGNAPFSRNGIKVMLFEVLFSPNHKHGQSNAKVAFDRLFPTVARVFWQFKVQDHTVLACLLQMLEAHLFLRIITKRIYREKPKIPLFTVHDSIVVPVEFANYVEYVMQQELTRWVGLTPTFTRTAWGHAPVEQAYEVV